MIPSRLSLSEICDTNRPILLDIYQTFTLFLVFVALFRSDVKNV